MVGDILVLNGGSSSLKTALFASDLRQKWHGLIQQHGHQRELRFVDERGALIHEAIHPCDSDRFHLPDAVDDLLRSLDEENISLAGIAHRVVHGGSEFTQATRVDTGVLEKLHALIPLAPLHQPHNLYPIEKLRAQRPTIPQIACFDTAFHHSIPWLHRLFALPKSLRDQGIIRYGFHGLSYQSIVQQLENLYPQELPARIVVAHLGSGASLCALQEGQSIDTTMGFTALEGLPMATRCGEIDPGVLLYLQESLDWDVHQVNDLLYRHSGLLGLSGISGDSRVLLASTHPEAKLAIEYFCYQIARHIAAMTASLNGIDLLVFTGGIGEHQATIRANVCHRLNWLGIKIDAGKNLQPLSELQDCNSSVAIRVLPCQEERVIAASAWHLLQPEAMTHPLHSSQN